jgi:predicted DNA-binding protein (MmcQ/YjbR family)
VTPAELREYALSKPGAWSDQPWEGDVVAKVGAADRGKIFAFLGDGSVMAYIGRSGWNTLAIGSSIPDDEIRAAVDDSYALVVAKLPKKHRPDGWESP